MHIPLVALPLLLLSVGPVAAAESSFANSPIKDVTASSSLDTTWPFGVGPRLPPPLVSDRALTPPPAPQRFGPELALDSDPGTAWVPEGRAEESWIRLDLGEERFVKELRVIGRGALGGEEPTQNARVKTLTVSAPNTVIDLPSRTFELTDTDGRQTLDLRGAVYDALNLTVEQTWPGPSGHLAVSEVSGAVLPISPGAVRALLELDEGASMSAIATPGRPDQHIVAWSAPVEGQLAAELVGVAGRDTNLRILWRKPIGLQWRGADQVDLHLQPVSFGGPPALLVTYRFEAVGTNLAFARVYIMGESGPSPAWETSLIGDLHGLSRKTLAFGGGRARISTQDEDLGTSMVQQVFRYDGSFRQFEPAPNETPGVSIRVPGGGSAAKLVDGLDNTALIVKGDGVGAEITLQFAEARRISAIRVLPGTTEGGDEGGAHGYTRPSQLSLIWPGGHSMEAELDDAPELQTVFEGWEGPTAEPTRSVTLKVLGVYPAVPGTSMAIAELEVYFLEAP